MVNEVKRKIQLEAFNALKTNNFNGIFLLPTGTGKSWVLIECLKYLVKHHNVKKIWYLCNSIPLRDTDFIKELKAWDAEDLIPLINRMCYQTAYKMKDEEVDVLIADEFDYSLTEEYSKVYFNNKFQYKILTTAFIDKKKLKLSETIADIIYSKGLEEVENSKALNKSQYYFVNFLMSDEETKRYLQYNENVLDCTRKKANIALDLALKGEDHKEYPALKKKYQYAEFRLDTIVRARKRFLNSLQSSVHHCRKLMNDIYRSDNQCRILTFCELTKQADEVCKYSYHTASDPENLEKFRRKEIQSLSVCGKINRGVNIPGVNYIIFESCNQSKTQFIQRLGRGKRLLIDEFLKVYFLIPCYYENGKLRYTKIKDWINNASGKLDLSKAKLYRFKS